MNLNQLRAERARLLNEAKAKAESPDFNEVLSAEVDGLIAKADDIKAQIARLEKLETEVSALEEPASKPVRASIKAGEDFDADKKFNAAFNTYLRNGLPAMDAEERQFLSRRGEYKATDTGQTRTTTTKGGYLVPTSMVKTIEEALTDANAVRGAGVTILNTDDGNEIKMPTVNDTDVKGRIVDELTSTSLKDISFGQASIKAHNYTSDIIMVSNQLLADSAVDLPSLIGKIAGERIGRAQNEHFTIGTGTGQPSGLITGATSGKVAAGTVAVTIDELQDLYLSVKSPYRSNAKFMMNDNTFGFLSGLKDTTNRPLLLRDYINGGDDKLFGKQVVINNDMPDLAASAKAILFGDFSKYFVRDVNGFGIRRLEERYADQDATAFLLFKRSDAVLLDAGAHPVKYLAMAAA